MKMPDRRRMATGVIDIGLVFCVVGIIALLWTGGYRLELGSVELRSHHLAPVLRNLTLLAALRVLVASGLTNALLVLGAVAISLLAAEGILRLWDPPLARHSLLQIHTPSPQRGWQLVPDARGIGLAGELIHVNSSGMRDIERRKQRSPGVKRVAAIGDSFTFGMAVDIEDTYVKQLERILIAQGTAVEVLNFGVIGYDMWQYRAVLEEEVLEFEPDLIVVGFFLDDMRASFHPARREPGWKPSNPFEAAQNDQPGFSSVWNLVRNVNHLIEVKYRYRRGYKYLQGIEERRQEISPDNTGHDYYRLQVDAGDVRLYLDFQEALGSFAEIARRRGIPVLALYIPDASQLHEAARQEINRFLATSTDKAGIPLLDVTPSFEASFDPRQLYLFPIDAHTSPDGHGLIAEKLANTIVSLGLLTP